MTTSSYGQMRATDADREDVRSILLDAHAEGRLDWDEFDARTTALMTAQTYGQLAELTADLPTRIPESKPHVFEPMPLAPRPTNGLAVASLALAILQMPFWLLTGIPAIILGHKARRQIRQTGEDGAGMALIGLILGYIGVAVALLGTIFIVALISLAFHAGGPAPGGH
jgi:hypothetical protein